MYSGEAKDGDIHGPRCPLGWGLSGLKDRFLHLLLSPSLTQASASPTPSSVLGQVDGVKQQASVLHTGQGGQLEPGVLWPILHGESKTQEGAWKGSESVTQQHTATQ